MYKITKLAKEELETNLNLDDDISEQLSDKYGWLVNDFTYSLVEEDDGGYLVEVKDIDWDTTDEDGKKQQVYLPTITYLYIPKY